MRITWVVPFVDDSAGDPDEQIQRFPILRELPAALVRRGHDVTVIALATRAARLDSGGASYHFVEPGLPAWHVARLLQRWKPRHGPAWYAVTSRLAAAVRASQPEIVHVSGLSLELHLAQLLWTARRLNVPLTVHFHGGEPATGRIRHLQRAVLPRIAGLAITTREQARPWLDAGLLAGPEVVFEVVETSSPFRALPRAEARQRSGLRGDPVYLHAGRLEPIKDPHTTLSGFERIAERQPAARLYLCYRTGSMEQELRERIARSPLLAERVTFLGHVEADRMEAVYSSADILLQASLREWSGLAVIEAMSCGCVPVVSDIPAFRALTCAGRAGQLFSPGDAGGLARAALEASSHLAELSAAARGCFTKRLSFDAIAGQLEAMFVAVRAARG